MRWFVAFALCASACGRWKFDAVPPSDGRNGDGNGDAGDAAVDAPGTSGVFQELALPPGGAFESYTTIGSDGSVRYVVARSQRVYRSTDGLTWTPCPRVDSNSLAIDTANVVYLATGTDVYASTDACATWTPTGLGPTNRVLAAPEGIFAATDQGLRLYTAGTWSVISTPAEGTGVVSIARNPSGDMLAGTYTGAIYKPAASSSWQTSTGLPAGDRVGIIALGLDQAGIVPAYASDAESNELDCSSDGGATWAMCNGLVATSLLPSATARDALLAGLYDDLVSSPDRMSSVTTGLRTANVHSAWVNGIAGVAGGGTAIATVAGVFEASPGGYNWEDRNTGLDAWSIDRITVTANATYVALDMGVMRSVAAAPFEMITTGMTHNTQVFDVFDAGGTLLAGGRYVRTSTDGGMTWSEVFDTNNDGFRATSFAMSGTTVFAGTWTRVLRASPPYTSWTPFLVAGLTRKIYDVQMRDTTLYVAAENGVFTSIDNGQTYTQIAALPASSARRIVVLTNGRVAVGVDNGVWISDMTVATWTQHLAGEAIEDVASDGAAIAVVEGGTVKISHDGGATWNELAGLVGRHPRTAAFDTTGGLLVGCDHNGLWRAPSP